MRSERNFVHAENVVQHDSAGRMLHKLARTFLDQMKALDKPSLVTSPKRQPRMWRTNPWLIRHRHQLKPKLIPRRSWREIGGASHRGGSGQN
jgi:hypothetical protein